MLANLGRLLKGIAAQLNTRDNGAIFSTVQRGNLPTRASIFTVGQQPGRTKSGALPPQTVDSPNGRVSYLSTLSNPAERQATVALWNQSSPVQPLPYDATGLRGSSFSTPAGPTDTTIQDQNFSFQRPITGNRLTMNVGRLPVQSTINATNKQLYGNYLW